MQNNMKMSAVFYVIIGIIFFTFAVDSADAAKTKDKKYKKGRGELVTVDGLKFTFKFYPTKGKGPTAIYIPGMGGRTGEGPYLLAPLLNKANFNFIAFDRAGSIRSGSLKEHNRNAKKRSKSGAATYPSIDGKESAAQNVVRNEIKTLIEFIGKAPSHDTEKGIYLIGESWGSLIALDTVRSYPENIKGVVFLSPSILPEFVSIEFERKYAEYNFNVVNYWNSLVKSYGECPGLAIGNKTDIIAPHLSKKGSALDSAKLLRRDLGPNIEVMEVSNSDHGGKLIKRRSKVKDKIVSWLTGQMSSI